MVEIQRLSAQAVASVLDGHSLDAALAEAWRRQPAARDRPAIQDLVYGTLRFLPRYEALLELLLERPVEDARLRALLLVALDQLGRTRAAPHAVVDHAVRTAVALKLASTKGLVNAVLRNFLRRRAELEPRAQRTERARYCHPEWWIDKLRSQYPSRHVAVLEADNAHPPLALRVNARRSSVAAYLDLLAQRAIAAEACGDAGVLLAQPLPAERIPGLAEGLVSVQDAAAQLAAPLLDARDGMRVLDACSAPGGKATHILERAAVDLTALDNDDTRLARVRSNLARLGLEARVARGDAGVLRDWWDGKPYDRILADVPCSASGIVRRHPDIKWLRRSSDLAQFARAQARLLDALWQTLASDGKLLYATCSVFQEENSEQIAAFLDRHRDAKRLSLHAVDDGDLPAGQLLPDGRHDGFFYALLQKS